MTIFIALSVKIESTEKEPKPFDINATLVGVFEVTELRNEKEERNFVIEGTKIIDKVQLFVAVDFSYLS